MKINDPIPDDMIPDSIEYIDDKFQPDHIVDIKQGNLLPKIKAGDYTTLIHKLGTRFWSSLHI